MTPKPGWHMSNKLAETGNGFDDPVDIAIACLVAGVSDKFARDALYLAHVQPSRHQPAADAHDSARAGEQPATTFSTRGGNGLGRTRQTPEQGLHRVGGTFLRQEIEDDSHGSFRDWPVNTHITGDLVDELVHGLLVCVSCSASKTKTYCALHLPRQGRAKIWRRRVANRQRWCCWNVAARRY